MNKYTFLFRNIVSKGVENILNPSTLFFYLKTYVFRPLGTPEISAYVVSYPKCGRTWLRVMLAKYLQIIQNVEDFSPDILGKGMQGGKVDFNHDQSNWVPAPVCKNKINTPDSKFMGKPVIFIIRDPRDILISSYMHLRYRERLYKDSLAAFVRDDYVGIDKIINFMNVWDSFLEGHSQATIISYEDMLNDPVASLTVFLHGIGIMDVSDEAVNNAVDFGRFENMKKLESSGEAKIPWLRPGNKKDPRTFKTREGRSGTYKEHLSIEDLEYVNSRIKNKLAPRYSRYVI